MTLQEYRKEVESELRSAKSEAEVNSILRTTKAVLVESKISATEVRTFWAELHSKLRISIKEVNYSAVHDFLAYALQQVAQQSAEASK